MISNKVKEKLNTFLSSLEPLLSLSPFYTLDYSWPSFAFFDSLTRPLRGKKNLDQFSTDVISATAAYLAIIAHDCWQLYESEVIVDLQEEGVIIGARKGKFIPESEEVVLYIERDLKKILAEFPYPFPVFSDFKREIAPYMNILSPFAIGVVTGLSPYIEGPWSKLKPVEFKDNIELTVKHLAEGCANYYAKIFPNEPLGQVAELYLNSLIFPPILYSEDAPGRRAVSGILEFAKEYKVTKENLLALSLNLSRFPDEVLSLAGIAISSALTEKENPHLVAAADIKGLFLGTLRIAMYDVVEHFKLAEDWLKLEDYSDQNKKQIDKEINLGYFPWLKLSNEKVYTAANDEEVKKLIKALAVFDLKKAITITDDIIAIDPSDIEIRVQRAYCDIIKRDIQSASSNIKKLLSEPEADSVASVFNLYGMILLITQEFEKAINLFKQAQNLAAGDPRLSNEISNNLGWTQMCNMQHQEALDTLELALQRNPKSLVTMLNKMACLIELNKFNVAARYIKELVDLAPFENRAISAALEILIFRQST